MSKKEWSLKAESEWRCVIGEGETITLQLIEGNAEIFGMEVDNNYLMHENAIFDVILPCRWP